MSKNDTSRGQEFLPVAEAAERLGVPRLKVREAAARKLIPSRRDNQNKLRLDLSGTSLPDLRKAKSDGDTPPEMLMDLLFDEIEELHADLADAAAERSALRDLVGRQADALDRAAERMERDAGQKARLSSLLERALNHLEAGAAATDVTADRTTTIERLEKEIAERERVIEDRNAAVEKALQMSERAVALAAETEVSVRKGFWRRLLRL